MTIGASRPSPHAEIQEIWEWLHWANERLTTAENITEEDIAKAVVSPLELKDTENCRPDKREGKDYRLQISRLERSAIRQGFFKLARKEADPWSELCQCLERDNATGDFRKLVARMISGNLLHDRASVPSTPNRADVIAQRDAYVALLKLHYDDLGRLEFRPLAERLAAFDLCLEYFDCGEIYEIAKWSDFEKKLSLLTMQVKSLCDRKRGSDKAAKGVGAAILSDVARADIVD